MDPTEITNAMEEAMRLVYEARRTKQRLEDELHQVDASLERKEASADRIIAMWLSSRRTPNAE